MPVRFVIGRAGTGKTHRFFRAIVDALREGPLGPPIYWILPRQATFTAERELTVASGLGGFCRARVLSFDQLGRELLAECGGSAVPRITQLGRQMVLGRLLRKHESQLRYFGKVARLPGMASKLEATFAEFDRCGRDPADLANLSTQFSSDADADSLAAKLHDLALIYKAYTDYLGQDRLDPRRWMQWALSCISQSKRLPPATIYIDAFSEFDEFERRMSARLGKVCREMEISLLMDPASPVLQNVDHPSAELGTFHLVEDTYRRLMKALADEAAIVDAPILLKEAYRFCDPMLADVESAMAISSPCVGSASADRLLSGKRNNRSAEADPTATLSQGEREAIHLIEAPDRRSEVEHAARHVRELLSAGLRMRDIAVLTRKIELYADLINAVFREHDIRHFIDMRRPMAHHPLLVFLRAALGIIQENWDHDTVMLLIKTGLCGLTDEQADALENYVLEHHLRGPVWMQPDPWRWHRRLTRGDEDEQASPELNQCAEMDLLRSKIRDGIAPLLAMFPDAQATLTPRATVVAIYELFDRFGLSTTLAQWIAAAHASGNHELAAEHERAWAELGELFDQLVDLLGDEPATLGDFQEMLDAGLETFALAIAPPTVDEVLVGQIDRTRTHAVRAVLVLGMNEGIFPCSPAEASILSDHERSLLETRQFELSPGSERRLLDEEFLAYLAFTRASDHLYLSRSLADDASHPQAASPYWHRLLKLFPDLSPQTLPRDQRTDASLIATPRQLLTALMQWARDAVGSASADRLLSPNAEKHDPWPALYQWLTAYPTSDDALDRLRHRAWPALTYNNSAALSAQISTILFPTPLPTSVSQIEAFATCPFRHFLRYAIDLQPRDEEDVACINLGHAFHDILEKIVRQLLQKKQSFTSLSPEQSRTLVQACSQEIAQDLGGEMMLGNARNRYLLDRIERSLDQVLAAQQAVASHGQFKPAFGRIDFGSKDAKLPALSVATPGKREIQLRGRIDRVDLLEQEAAFAVMDYKLAGSSLNLSRVYHGLSLQLLAYMLVLKEHGQALTGKPLDPAGAFYIRLLRQLEKVDHPDKAPAPEDPAFALAAKPRGIFDGKYLSTIDNSPDLGSSEVIAAYLKKDGTFGNKSRTDVAEGDELPALLNFVKRQMAQLGDRILDGEIEIRPYRMGNITPCSSCAYRSVCRFDPAINRYRPIVPKGREEILKQVCTEVADA